MLPPTAVPKALGRKILRMRFVAGRSPNSVRNYEGSWLDWQAQEKSRGQNDD